MSNNELAPIIVFAYNRPHYLLETLQALEKNEEAQASILYIFCDGPKSDASSKDMENIAAVRRLARDRKWCGTVNVIESDVNNGLSKAIINGVTDIFEKHDKVIVLEDDLVVSPHFLNFLNKGLEKYKNNKEVISVTGYNYPINYPQNYPESFFLNTADCLGWGTWKHNWKLLEQNANKLIQQIENLNLVDEFNFNGQYDYFKMLECVAAGTTNSWAIRWYASAFINKKLTLFPKTSFVRHIGNEGTNVKADNTDFFGWAINMQPINYFEDKLEEDKNARHLLSMHFKKYNRRRLSIFTIKYVFKRFILRIFN